MQTLRIGPTALIALTLLLTIGRASAEGTVRVEVWEGLPASWDGKPPKAEPDDRFEVPALGFVELPAKYSARGIEQDRVAPFALHAEATLHVPAGPHRLVLRARGASRLLVDGRILAESGAIPPNSAGSEEVLEPPPPSHPQGRRLAPGDQEHVVDWVSDGAAHRVELWSVLGAKGVRPSTGELSVSVAAPGVVPVLIGGEHRFSLTDEGWSNFVDAEHDRVQVFDDVRRRAAARGEEAYWRRRHEQTRREALQDPPPPALGTPSSGNGNLVDRYIEAKRQAAGIEPSAPLDDAAFFRRLTLDTLGVIPEAGEVEGFLADGRPDKDARAVEARLADSRWADGWMGYWQDVLAENPALIKPTLNNTGPFRRYLHAALRDNTPIDRLVTELIRMEGSLYGGAPAGFGLATQNDAPMAAKSHILVKAFLAADLKCARCHDAPFHPFEQSDLFGLAALLDGKAQVIPATSTVRRQPGGRVPAVSVSLEAGDRVEPRWSLPEIGPETLPEGFLPEGAGPRERLAGLITSPRNTRFARVIVNRLWKRYLGVGLVEPVDDWDGDPTFAFPELLDALAFELVTHDYDLKHVARLLLTSQLYRSRPRSGDSSASPGPPLTPARRRMSAEQLLDSLFAAVGKPLGSEELTFDPDGRRTSKEFLDLGRPRRAWELVGITNERDRPALTLPVAQSLGDLLQTFGWRPSRQDPITVREETTTPLQPALLANGVVVTQRIARLSDLGAITALCLRDQPPEALLRTVFLRILSRPPTERETRRLVEFLGDTYAGRIVAGASASASRLLYEAPRVSWSNHLSPRATEIQLQKGREARGGDPPTARLTPEFRERMEDIVWALVNRPEFVFLP